MNRLNSTILWDMRLQFRNGFYYASAFVAMLFIIILKQFSNVDWTQWWPPIIMSNLAINSFYFLSAMVLLEKGEGTMEAQIVTPLRPREYLASKIISLGILSLFETLAVVVVVSGFAFNWLKLILGIMFLIAIYGLYGFFVVSRYDSINEFLLPSIIWTIWFSFPLLYYLDIWRHEIMYLHPIQAPLVLMQSAFEDLPVWQTIYGIGYSLVWVYIAYLVAHRAYYHFIVTKKGARKK